MKNSAIRNNMQHIEEIIKKLFIENSINIGIEEQIKVLQRTLRDQTHGYWSNQRLYNLAVKGGFLLDAKSHTNKNLTTLGQVFMENLRLNQDLTISIEEIITKLFNEKWTKNLVTEDIQEQKFFIYKILRDQVRGNSVNNTAYDLAVKGGFLLDAKSNTHEKLTTLGHIFIEEFTLTLPVNSKDKIITNENKGNFFVMLTNQKGDFTPLMACTDIRTYQSEVAKFETNEAAHNCALGSFLGKQFGYNVFEMVTSSR